MELSSEEKKRFARHITLPEMGETAQIDLKKAKVLIVGVGGLGCPAAQYLAAAGVGHLCLIDHDLITDSNLQRQILFSPHDLGKPKAEVAAYKLNRLHFYKNVLGIAQRFDTHNMTLAQNFDLILDCTDGIQNKYFLNDVALYYNKPLVYAAVNQFEGCLSVFNYKGSPHYRDLYPIMPPAQEVPSCAENGILGSFAGVIGTMQATEAIKCLLNLAGVLSGRICFVNALTWQQRCFKFKSRDFAKVYPALNEEAACSYIKITYSTFASWQNSNQRIYVLDIRETHERTKIYPEAYCWAWSTWQHDPAPVLPFSYTADDKLVLYCQSGLRSQKAAIKLRDLGLTNVYDLGGCQNWEHLL